MFVPMVQYASQKLTSLFIRITLLLSIVATCGFFLYVCSVIQAI
jgi:hypothetical protein